MTIKYRAVHERNSWRKVGSHSSLNMAVDGPDGAKRLLLRVGRIGQMWDKHGRPSYVFVWEAGSRHGYAFRIKPGAQNQVETVNVLVDLLEKLENAKTRSQSDFELCFQDSSMIATPPNAVASSSEEPAVSPERTSSDVAPAHPVTNGSYPDELPDGLVYPEGMARGVLVNAYERNAAARALCIEHYGAYCRVCEINFAETYGDIGRGFIQVHHIVPLATVNSVYSVHPVNDLVPVCPNCHAMLHMKDPPYTVAELRSLLK